MSKMTLEQVRDNLRLMHAGIVANNYMGQMADVIDAHLARQPDLAAIREVIGEISYLAKANSEQLEAWADALARAIGDKSCHMLQT